MANQNLKALSYRDEGSARKFQVRKYKIADNLPTAQDFIEAAKTTRKMYERIYPPSNSQDKIEIPKKSAAGTLWFEKSLKKTVAMYLLMNSIMLFFSSDYYIETLLAGESDVLYIGEQHKYKTSDAVIKKLVAKILDDHETEEVPVLQIKLTSSNGTWYLVNNQKRLDLLRESELYYHQYISDETSGQLQVDMVVDMYNNSFRDSLFQLFQLIFACLVLFYAYVSGSKDSGIYLSEPFKHIFASINKTIRNPLDYTVNPFYIDPQMKSSTTNSTVMEEYAQLGDFTLNYSRYLAMAFGNKQCNVVADKLIIKTPMSLTQVSGDVYNSFIVMLQLTPIDEHLNLDDETLLDFIKSSHEVIQRTSDKFGGACSYTKDGVYILTWRLIDENPKTAFRQSSRNSAEAATMAVTCVLKLITKLMLLRRYFNIDGLLDRIEINEKKRAKPKVDEEEESINKESGDLKASTLSLAEERPVSSYFNCIIHCGRVYEQITGGCLKLDVIYLGPDLIIVNNMHKMSQLYSMPIMLTELVFNQLSDSIKKQCRKIDIIMMKGLEKPIDLYSLDICGTIQFTRDSDPDRENFDVEAGSPHMRIFHGLIKEKILQRIVRGAKNSVYFDDPDIQALFKKQYDFKRACCKAIDFYSLGAWDMAKNELEAALKLEPDDGACWFLLKFLEHFGFTKPDFWRGYRLTDF